MLEYIIHNTINNITSTYTSIVIYLEREIKK